MELQPAVEQVAEQLAAAAALGDERTREIARGLAAAVDPAVRLAVLEALTAAADEITARLLDQPGSPSIAVRLDGDDVAIEVRTDAAAEARDAPHYDGEPTARISLRLSEALKTQVDASAAQDGVSVNTWLVRAAATAMHARSTGGSSRLRPTDARRITGWVNT